MKQGNFFTKGIFTFAAIAVSTFGIAQTAKFQLIHNSADPLMDSCDVYINGEKLDNFLFRNATTLQTVSSGVQKININNRNSSDSGNLVIARFTQTLAANSNTLLMLAGVINPSSFSANPNSVSTALRLISKTIPNSSAWFSLAGRAHINIFNGVTDALAADIVSKPVAFSGTIPTNLKFGDANVNAGGNPLFLSSVPTYFELKSTATGNVLRGYATDLTLQSQKFVTIFASGFINSGANMNGAEMGLFAADTSGTVWQISEAARLQLINNSPDIDNNSIDLYINDTKVISGIDFRKASPYITIQAGIVKARISKKNMDDTLCLYAGAVINSGVAYCTIASGVKDTSLYAANPNGTNRSFSIAGIDSVRENSSSPSAFQYYVINGVQDAAAIDFNRLSPASTIINDLVYNPQSDCPYFSSTSNFIFNISNANKSNYWASYNLPATSLLGQSGVVFTSGLYQTTGNPTGSQGVKLFAALSSGNVIEIKRLTGKMQFIHNSADSSIDKINIYANGVKIYDGLEFRHSTGLLAIDSYIPVRLNIAAYPTNDTMSSLWASTILPDSGYSVSITKGLANSTGYVANPDARSTSFGMITYGIGKLKPTIATNNELLFFNGLTDSKQITLQGEGEGLFMAYNVGYGSFNKYIPAKANAASKYYVSDVNGKIIGVYKANFVGKSGKTGVLFSSGFVKTIDTIIHKDATGKPKDTVLVKFNKTGPAVGFFIAWNDGTIDTLEIELAMGLSVDKINKHEATANIFPNPASTIISATYELPFQSTMSIAIYDGNGKLVKQISIEKASAGIHQSNINIEELQNGLYLIQLKTDFGVKTFKLVVE